MEASRLWAVAIFVVLFAGVKAQECAGSILGPIIAFAVIIELVTVAIAVASCLYFKIKLKRLSEEVGDQKPRLYSYSENGDDTIRVVHNTLYETLTRDRKNKINKNAIVDNTPLTSATEPHPPPAPMSSDDTEGNRYERSSSQEDVKDTSPTLCEVTSETREPDKTTPAEDSEDNLEGLSDDDGSVTVDASVTIF